MEFVCNELSLYPLVNSSQEAEEIFKNTLKTFHVFQHKFGFNHIRFPVDFQNQMITSSQTYTEWIGKISNKILKDTLSFNTHPFWQKRKITISKTNTSETENLLFSVYNVCLDSDHESYEFIEWTNTSMVESIDSVEILRKYLNFTKYTVDFTEDFEKQLFEWKKEDFKTFKYTLILMKDVQLHPFTGGMGQTENLKNRGKEASKRITNRYPEGDRLSYFLEKNNVTFMACKGHYKFH